MKNQSEITKKFLLSLIASDDLTEVLGKALEIFREEYKLNAGAFFLFNPSFERLKLESQFGFAPKFLNSLLIDGMDSYRYRDYSFFPNEDFTLYENLLLDDIIRIENNEGKKFSILILAIKDRKIKKGYLWLIKENPFEITGPDRDLFAELTDILSIKIHKAQIHHEMMRTVEQLERLLNIQNAFLMDLDLESIFKRILVEVKNMFNPSVEKFIRLEKNILTVLNEDGEEVELDKSDQRYEVFKGIIKDFDDVRDIKIVENNDGSRNPSTVEDFPYNVKSYALLPIFVETKCEGFVFLGKNITNHFIKEDFPLYVAFAIFSSQAIYLARLHKNILNLQEQLLKAQKMESIGILAGGIAHDFNNALAGVIGATDLIELEMKANPKIMKYLRLIRDSSKRMSHWTNQLIAYARGGKYLIEPVNMNQVIIDSLRILHENFSERITFIYTLEPHLLFIDADFNQMSQVVTNLILNSGESITVSGEIKISSANVNYDREYYDLKNLDHKLTYIKISVQDSGCGIDEQMIEKVFEPFVTTKFQGRGLGLSAVYGIVENHNGKVMLESELNKGTVVEIFLPTREITSYEAPQSEKLYGNILFMNKDDVSHRLITEQLIPKGYTVIETSQTSYSPKNIKWKIAIIDSAGFNPSLLKKSIDDYLSGKYFEKIIIFFDPDEEEIFSSYAGISGIKLFPKPIDPEMFTKLLLGWLGS